MRVRDYLHVEDLAPAHLRVLGYLREAGRSVTLNVGYGHGYSVREVLRMVEAVAGQALTIREEQRRAGDPAYLVARADRVRTELGWQPRFDDLRAIVSSSLVWERKLLTQAWG
jgi:UDP-glucose 4-epimerase